MSMKRALVTSVLLTVALLAPGAALVPAQADDPIDVTQQITDEAGVLGADRAEVRKALDRFFDRTGLQLYVVYVPNFDDLTGAEWAARTAEKSGLGKADLLLAVATKDRAYGYETENTTFTDENLENVDRTRIMPALRNDEFAGAAIEAADGYGDIAEDEGLPWGGIVVAVVLVLAVGAFLVRRSRKRFERSHHVLDEHGDPVDPAAILDLEELDDVANRALVAVDDALLTSHDELRHVEAEFTRSQTDGFRFAVDRGRTSMREAFALRHQLDEAVTTMAEGRRRKTMSRVVAICEEIDHSLDDQAEAFDALRDWSNRVPHMLDGLTHHVDDLVDRRPTGQASRLVVAAQEQIERARKELGDDESKYAVAHTRAAEEAVAQAAMLLVDQPDALTAVDQYVTTHRAAVRARARTLLSEAGRHRRAGHEAEAERLVEVARSTAEADVAAWNERQETRGDRRRSPTIETLVLGGILVKPIGRNGLGGIGSLLGGSTHGGGSGAPYGGSQRPGSTRTPGSFGGTRTRGRRGGRGRF